MAQVVLCVLLLLCFTAFGTAIKCYESNCGSNYGLTCTEPFKTSSIPISDNCLTCQKRITSVLGRVSVERLCNTFTGVNEQNGCTPFLTGGTNITTCICNSNLCNGAGTTVLSVGLLVATGFIAAWLA